MATDKQERTVIHLELGAEHHNFGSIKALCDHFGKEQIGITYKSLANIGITPDKPYRNKFCTFRKGTLLTAPKAVSENGGELFFAYRVQLYDFICTFGV